MTRLKIGCVADDFTGASDAASFLAKGGLRTYLFNETPEGPFPEGAQAAVIALKSRTQETPGAVSDSLSAAQRLLEHRPDLLYIKYCSTFDSTPSGNIGPVCDAVMELLGVPYTLLCPSLPVNGRTVEDGILYAGGIPLAGTHMRNHPLTPMTKSYIPDLMEPQSRYPSFLLRREVYAGGREAVYDEVRKYRAENGHFYLVPDFSTDEDAAALAALFGDLPLLTGGSGLLTELAKRFSAGVREIEDAAPAFSNKAVILAGSCSAATTTQVKRYLGEGGFGIMVDPNELAGRPHAAEDIWEQVRSAGLSDALVYSSGSAGGRVDTENRERNAGLLEDTLARVARLAVEEGYTGIVVAGGETSGAVTRALGYTGYRIGESIAPGVPVMIPLQDERIRLVLKSGNFGQDDFFGRALVTLRGD